LFKHLSIFCLWITGWNTNVLFPQRVKKCIIIVGPHTSAWDIVMGLLYRSAAGLSGTRFLGKQELFDSPLGFLFKWLGGTPVDRCGKQNMVEQVVELFNSQEAFRLALSPEGTRQKVSRLRTGFYHIARGAKVPIIMAGMDYKNKNLIFSKPFYPGSNEAVEWQKVILFFASIQGCNPELGTVHLLKRDLSNSL
jgi:1-acyl-sn-glycerol-3-phosphate acyltransferase